MRYGVLLAGAGVALLMVAPAGGGLAQAAGAPAAIPGAFVVHGRPLAHSFGKTISVYAKPRALVSLDGCRSSAARVRLKGKTGTISARVSCPGLRGRVDLSAKLAGTKLRGTFGKRRFSAGRLGSLRVPVSGPPGASALGHLRSVFAVTRHADSELSTIGKTTVARTELVVLLKAGATVAQANAALDSDGARLASSSPVSTLLLVSIPDPGSAKALQSVASSLRSKPGIQSVFLSPMSETEELPPLFTTPFPTGDAGKLHHLLAAGLPAAWNARHAIVAANQPTLVIADHFGNGPLSSHVAATYDTSELKKLAKRDSHGYHVVGIAAGDFANDGTPAGSVTGVFPATAKLVLFDATGFSYPATSAELIKLMSSIPGRIVLNTSLGSQFDDAESRAEASDWAVQVRHAGLEDRVVHAASAGNDAASTTDNGVWSPAGVRNDLTNSIGDPITPLQNTLAVENLTDSGAPLYTPGCLSLLSDRGGNIAAVGENVYSNLLGSNAGFLSGTSMASPQVAAVAEYLWTIAPALSSEQIVSAIEKNGLAPLPNDAGHCGTDLPSAPRLAAYASLLSLDQAPLSPAKAPVRFAVLDANGDGQFDGKDLSLLAPTVLRASDAGHPDWSRFDLNGDGYTGGARAVPFDLDLGTLPGEPPHLGTVTETIEGLQVPFDETHATDGSILCYYAYSPLFSTSPASVSVRTSLLKSYCTRAADILVVNRNASAECSAVIDSAGKLVDDSEPDGVAPFDRDEHCGFSLPNSVEGTTYTATMDSHQHAVLARTLDTGAVSMTLSGSATASLSPGSCPPCSFYQAAAIENSDFTFTVTAPVQFHVLSTWGGYVADPVLFVQTSPTVGPVIPNDTSGHQDVTGTLQPGSYEYSTEVQTYGDDNKSSTFSLSLTLTP